MSPSNVYDEGVRENRSDSYDTIESCEFPIPHDRVTEDFYRVDLAPKPGLAQNGTHRCLRGRLPSYLHLLAPITDEVDCREDGSRAGTGHNRNDEHVQSNIVRADPNFHLDGGSHSRSGSQRLHFSPCNEMSKSDSSGDDLVYEVVVNEEICEVIQADKHQGALGVCFVDNATQSQSKKTAKDSYANEAKHIYEIEGDEDIHIPTEKRLVLTPGPPKTPGTQSFSVSVQAAEPRCEWYSESSDDEQNTDDRDDPSEWTQHNQQPEQTRLDQSTECMSSGESCEYIQPDQSSGWNQANEPSECTQPNQESGRAKPARPLTLTTPTPSQNGDASAAVSRAYTALQLTPAEVTDYTNLVPIPGSNWTVPSGTDERCDHVDLDLTQERSQKSPTPALSQTRDSSAAASGPYTALQPTQAGMTDYASLVPTPCSEPTSLLNGCRDEYRDYADPDPDEHRDCADLDPTQEASRKSVTPTPNQSSEPALVASLTYAAPHPTQAKTPDYAIVPPMPDSKQTAPSDTGNDEYQDYADPDTDEDRDYVDLDLTQDATEKSTAPTPSQNSDSPVAAPYTYTALHPTQADTPDYAALPKMPDSNQTVPSDMCTDKNRDYADPDDPDEHRDYADPDPDEYRDADLDLTQEATCKSTAPTPSQNRVVSGSFTALQPTPDGSTGYAILVPIPGSDRTAPSDEHRDYADLDLTQEPAQKAMYTKLLV